jgi:hypothetical protein
MHRLSYVNFTPVNQEVGREAEATLTTINVRQSVYHILKSFALVNQLNRISSHTHLCCGISSTYLLQKNNFGILGCTHLNIFLQ